MKLYNITILLIILLCARKRNCCDEPCGDILVKRPKNDFEDVLNKNTSSKVKTGENDTNNDSNTWLTRMLNAFSNVSFLFYTKKNFNNEEKNENNIPQTINLDEKKQTSIVEKNEQKSPDTIDENSSDSEKRSKKTNIKLMNSSDKQSQDSGSHDEQTEDSSDSSDSEKRSNKTKIKLMNSFDKQSQDLESHDEETEDSSESSDSSDSEKRSNKTKIKLMNSSDKQSQDLESHDEETEDSSESSDSSDSEKRSNKTKIKLMNSSGKQSQGSESHDEHTEDSSDSSTSNESLYSYLAKHCELSCKFYKSKYYFAEECILESEKLRGLEDHIKFSSRTLDIINKDNINNITEFILVNNRNTMFSFGEEVIDFLTERLFYGVDFAYLLKNICCIEGLLYVRFDEMYKYITKLNFRLDKFLETEDTARNLEIVEKMTNFFNNYFLNFEIMTYFNKKQETTDLSDKEEKSLIKKILPEIYTEFNKVYFNYCKGIFPIISNPAQKYFPKYKESMCLGSSQYIKEKELFLMNEILNLPFNRIVLALFPEIKFYIEEMMKRNDVLDTYHLRSHIFIAFITLKIQGLRDFLKMKHSDHENQPEFNPLDSKIIRQLIFEIKAFISFYSYSFLKDAEGVKVMLFKTFLSFLRLKNPDLLKHFIINEFMDTNKCLIKKISRNIIGYKGQDENKEEETIDCELISLIGKEIINLELQVNFPDNPNRKSFHLRNCPMFDSSKKYNDDEIHDLFNDNLEVINTELRNFIFYKNQ